jgi:hypothetical protein
MRRYCVKLGPILNMGIRIDAAARAIEREYRCSPERLAPRLGRAMPDSAASKMLAVVVMGATESQPNEDGARGSRGWRTLGMTLGIIALAVACIIPLGVSIIFWGPLAIVIALVMWYGATRRNRIPADAYRRHDTGAYRPPRGPLQPHH